MLKSTPLEAATQADLAHEISERLDAALKSHLEQAYAPENVKELRLFSATETAELLECTPQYLRKCHADGSLPEPAKIKNGRRYYSADEIAATRQNLGLRSAKARKKYLPGRHEGDGLQVIQFMNFKGGSAKSTSAIHVCHYLALKGYRVLAIDLDPQGSLTGFCGIDTELDFEETSIYDALKYEDPVPMQEVIFKTYFAGLDIAPANLRLSEFEMETAAHASERGNFYKRLSAAIAEVDEYYDVVIIDSPPSLGFLTLTGVYASTSVIVPLTPSMLDLASTKQFVHMFSEYIGTLEDQGIFLDYDFFSFLITRDDPSDVPSQQIVSLMRTLFPYRVLPSTCVRSTAISDASLLKMSIYEMPKSEVTRSTYERAKNSMDSVGEDISKLIQTAWGRDK